MLTLCCVQEKNYAVLNVYPWKYWVLCLGFSRYLFLLHLSSEGFEVHYFHYFCLSWKQPCAVGCILYKVIHIKPFDIFFVLNFIISKRQNFVRNAVFTFHCLFRGLFLSFIQGLAEVNLVHSRLLAEISRKMID